MKNIDKVAKAIEKDAGQEIPGLRESLAEMKSGEIGREYSPDQLLAIEARKILKMTQPEFARILDTPVGTYRDWEQGRFGIPGAVRVLFQLILEKPNAVMPTLKRRVQGDAAHASS